MKKIIIISFICILCFSIASTKHPALVVEYKFEGNANDNGGNGLNGTVSSPGPTLAAGKFGQCYSFTDTFNYISLPNGLYSVLNSRSTGISYSAWVSCTQVNLKNNIIGQKPTIGYSDYASGGIKIEAYKAIMICYSSPSYRRAIGSTTLSNNVWYFIVGTYNPIDKRLKVYLNGRFDGQSDTISTFSVNAANNSNQIGISLFNIHTNVYQCPFKGSIDDAKIWRKALSIEDQKRIMSGFMPL